MWWLIPTIITAVCIIYSKYMTKDMKGSNGFMFLDLLEVMVAGGIILLSLIPALIAWIIYLGLRVWLGIV